MSAEQTEFERIASVQERARYLLDIGVAATLTIDPEKLEPAYAAEVPGFGRLPVPLRASEQTAIAAGTDWLRAKAEG